LKRQGYNDKVIDSGFSKASEINRNDLLEYKEKKINKRVSLCLVVSTVEHIRFAISINHVVTSAVSNCNMHKCSLAR
jgi:hypothetical protein